jgi:periplasmic protein TonB
MAAMGYQALLFCSDEKTAGLVTQVLAELEFSVEPANEPFAAVKRLTTQHFDAVVVDCDNEQNAALLFKSARNSGPNKTSLAVAVVEGQPGIAKAFRIGANLVLTKPINIEQSKGTLRVARGLLKKPEAGKPAATAPLAPAATPKATPTNPAFARPLTPGTPQSLKPAVPPKSITSRPAPPVVRAEAPSMLELEAEPTPQAESADAALLESMPAPVTTTPAPKSITQKAAWPPAAGNRPFPGTASSTGGAAAVAPARETARPSETLVPKPAAASAPTTSEPVKPVARAPRVETQSSAPILSTPEPTRSGAMKWIIIVLLIALAAAGGYFASLKLHPKSPVPSSAPPVQTTQPASAPAQDITLDGTPSAASSQPAPATPERQAVPEVQSPAPEKTSAEPDVTVKKISPAPSKPQPERVEKPVHEALVIKNSSAKSVSQPEAPQAVPVMGIASSSGDKALAGIMEAKPAVPVLRTMRVSQGVSQGMILKRVSPEYPMQARQLRIEGMVQLEATVAKDGKVKDVRVVSGHPILARAAVDAVKRWKYKPYLLNGAPIEIDTEITVNFKLP